MQYNFEIVKFLAFILKIIHNGNVAFNVLSESIHCFHPESHQYPSHSRSPGRSPQRPPNRSGHSGIHHDAGALVCTMLFPLNCLRGARARHRRPDRLAGPSGVTACYRAPVARRVHQPARAHASQMLHSHLTVIQTHSTRSHIPLGCMRHTHALTHSSHQCTCVRNAEHTHAGIKRRHNAWLVNELPGIYHVAKMAWPCGGARDGRLCTQPQLIVVASECP